MLTLPENTMKKFIFLCAAICCSILLCLQAAAAEPAVKTQTPAQTKPAFPVHANAVKQQPVSVQIMYPPQLAQFQQVTNASGSYTLLIPRIFGSNPLADFTQVNGPMLVYAADENTTMMAVNITDPMDFTHYKPLQSLPEADNKQVLEKWLHPSALNWHCTLSRQNDFNGDKLLLQAQTSVQNKNYELLYIFPFEKYNIFVPQVLYSLNSFKII